MSSVDPGVNDSRVDLWEDVLPFFHSWESTFPYGGRSGCLGDNSWEDGDGEKLEDGMELLSRTSTQNQDCFLPQPPIGETGVLSSLLAFPFYKRP